MTSTIVRTSALNRLKAPSRMSDSVIGCSGSGPVRSLPPFGPDAPYGGP